MWFIAWFFVFSPIFVTQGSPFRKLGMPGAAIAQTILSIILGYICWQGSLMLGVSPTFSFGAVGSSLILWPLVYSWMFGFAGVAKYKQPKRGILAFLIILVIMAIWIIFLRLVLSPVAAAAAAAGPPVSILDVNLLTIYFNLCVLAPALIAHNAFWLRAPLTLPPPPGTPPPDKGV